MPRGRVFSHQGAEMGLGIKELTWRPHRVFMIPVTTGATLMMQEPHSLRAASLCSAVRGGPQSCNAIVLRCRDLAGFPAPGRGREQADRSSPRENGPLFLGSGRTAALRPEGIRQYFVVAQA